MAWLQLHVELDDPDRLPQLEDRLMGLGAVAVTLTDAGDTPVLEPGPGETPLWPGVSVAALFPADTQTALVDLAMGETAARWSPLADRQWEREWLRDFSPMRFGDRLWICPYGDTPPGPGETVVYIEPGLGFGTGTHATTALCLDWLAGADLNGTRILDYGCGSGILAVAALKLGAREAVAVDIDDQALVATRENAARNGVECHLRVEHADQPTDGRFDIVMANILANPLIELAPRLAGFLQPEGRLVLSGLLEEQSDEVMAAYAAAVAFDTPALRAGWARLGGMRRPD